MRITPLKTKSTTRKPAVKKQKKKLSKKTLITSQNATLTTKRQQHAHVFNTTQHSLVNNAVTGHLGLLKRRFSTKNNNGNNNEDDGHNFEGDELEVLLNSVGADSNLQDGEYSITPLTQDQLDSAPRKADEDISDLTMDSMLGTKPRENPFGYKTPDQASFKTNKRQQKKMDELYQQQYGQFVNMNDHGEGLVWAGNLESDQQQKDAANAAKSGDNADVNADVPAKQLHEQIIQLYLENYDQQEHKELEANFDRQELQHQREQFVQTLVNTLTPKSYARFVHYFRICIQRMRTLLIKHQQAKDALAKNVHLYVSVAKQQALISSQYQTDVQEVKIQFFRQASRLFGEGSDTFMPQLVIYLSSLTLQQLESARDRKSSASMNPYSCGFWSAEDTAAFTEQFSDYLEACGISTGEHDLVDAQGKPKKRLIDATFPVPIANKLYSTLDIHTDMTSPLLWAQLNRIEKRSHKVFVQNIPSTLTTRELMTLFGNCGVLNAAEIFRDLYVYGNDGDEDGQMDAQITAEQLHHQQQLDLQQGISISKREALLQANAAALTVDIADLSLGHFTSSFKSDRLMVPSHVLDAEKLQKTIQDYFKSQELLLAQESQSATAAALTAHGGLHKPKYDSEGNLMDNAGDMFHNNTFNETLQQNFQMELQKFEQQHHKKMQRQQKKLFDAMQDEGVDPTAAAQKDKTIYPDELGLDQDILEMGDVNQQQTPVGEQMDPSELPGVNTPYNQSTENNNNKKGKKAQLLNTEDFDDNTNNNNTPQKPKAVTDQLLQFNFKIKQQGGAQSNIRDKFKINEHHSPVHGYLYFATEEGKKRALKQALQIFGVSTASGYAMVTSDAENKKQIIISNLHRSMTSGDVSAFVRNTLSPHMSLTRSLVDNENGEDNGDNNATTKTDNNSDIKTSILERVYLPRSFNRIGGQTRRAQADGEFKQDDSIFNLNRGYAILSFDSHESASQAFRYLSDAAISPEIWLKRQSIISGKFAGHRDGVEEINPDFDVSGAFQNHPTLSDQTTNQHQARRVHVVWRQDKFKKRRQPHPVTSYFPTFERPKSALYMQVNQQLKQAFDKDIKIESIQ